MKKIRVYELFDRRTAFTWLFTDHDLAVRQQELLNMHGLDVILIESEILDSIQIWDTDLQRAKDDHQIPAVQ